MAFYYVKDDGTATGDAGRATSVRTTSFATMGTSAYYSDVADALATPTTAPVAGDFIMCSDVHDVTYGANTTYACPVKNALFIVSVDDTSAEVYKVGASETASGGNFDLGFSGSSSWHGLTMSVVDDFNFASSNTDAKYTDCNLILTSGGSVFRNLSNAGVSLQFINTTISWSGGCDSAAFLMRSHSSMEMFSGAIVATTGDIDAIVTDQIERANRVLLVGVDLSDLVTIVEGSGDTSTDDGFLVELHRCQFSSTLTSFATEAFYSHGMKLLVTNSTDVSADTEFQYFYRTQSGDVEDQQATGIVRADSTAFPGGDNISLQITTTATCSIFQPLVFDFPSQYAALATASTDTIRIFFTVENTTTLTDTNVWAEVIYPDGTNQHVPNFLSIRNADPLATGTTHTMDSGSDWEDNGVDLTGHNEYQMDLDTSGDVGADCVPIIRVHVGIASKTIYFDTTIGIVA